MSKLSDISYIKELMNNHGVNFSKALGQNFLVNPTVCPRMAENAGAEDGVIEVGAGVGVLTYELSQLSPKVVCIELDKRLLPLLDESLKECDNVKIVNADVMKIDLKQLIEDEFEGKEVSVCANLPYYITSPVIMRFLEEKLPIKYITVMVQKEAADRICAEPGKRECGAISAAVRYYCEPEILFQVGKGSFMPSPKVDSTVIRLKLHKEAPFVVDSEKIYFRMVKAVFGQRRKNLLNSLSNGMGISKDMIKNALKNAEIAENLRGEALSFEDLCRLSNELYKEIKSA